MKITYEQIYLGQSKSLKIESYTNKSHCEIVNWHLHPEYELVFIKSGQGNIQIDSHHEAYQNGLLIFLGPNIPHMPFGNKQFKNNIEVVIQFPENFLTEKLAHFPEFNDILAFVKRSKSGIVFSTEIHQKLKPSFLKFSKQNNTEKLLNFIDILHQLSISKNQRRILKGSLSLDTNKQALERISKVYQYVNDNYGKEIRSENLAKQLGLTPNSFCRMFKTTTHRSFIDFLNAFRIKKAQEHFDRNHDILISEVMYQCGFNDPSYFSKQFKKYAGLSPSSYANRKLEIS